MQVLSTGLSTLGPSSSATWILWQFIDLLPLNIRPVDFPLCFINGNTNKVQDTLIYYYFLKFILCYLEMKQCVISLFVAKSKTEWITTELNRVAFYNMLVALQDWSHQELVSLNLTYFGIYVFFLLKIFLLLFNDS